MVDQVHNSVEIERFECNYTLNSGHYNPTEIQTKLDGIARNILPSKWDGLSNIDVSDPSIYFIKSIEVDTYIDPDLDEDEIAHIWCSTIASTIVDNLQTNENIVKFPNKQEYIKGFILDLLDDMAWDRWYYDTFNDLKSQTKRSIIMTIFGKNPDIIEPILLSMADEDSGTFFKFFDKLDDIFYEEDFKEIYDILLPWDGINFGKYRELDYRLQRDDNGDDRIPEFVTDILDGMIFGKYRELDYRLYLSIYLNLLKNTYLDSPENATFVRSKMLHDYIIKSVTSYQTSSTHASVESMTAEALHPIILHSDFGVLFILAKYIHQIDPVMLVQNSGFLPFSGYNGLNWLIASIAAKLYGMSLDEKVYDEGFGIFTGLEGCSPILIDEYASTVSSDSVAALKASLVGMFHENGLLKGDYLWIQKDPATGTIMVQDIETQFVCWGDLDKEVEIHECVNRFVELYKTECEKLPGCLIFDKELTPEIDFSAFDMKNLKFIAFETDFTYSYPDEGYVNYRIIENGTAGTMHDVVIEGNGNRIKYRTNLDIPVAQYISALKKRQPIDDYMEFFKPTSDFEIVVSIAAGSVIKMFTRDLRGFENSSPGYILKNFLSGDSVIELNDGGNGNVNGNTIKVSIRGIPLAVALVMAGVCTGIFRVPWIYEKEIEVMIE